MNKIFCFQFQSICLTVIEKSPTKRQTKQKLKKIHTILSPKAIIYSSKDNVLYIL